MAVPVSNWSGQHYDFNSLQAMIGYTKVARNSADISKQRNDDPSQLLLPKQAL